MKNSPLTDDDIRRWILSDALLYCEARRAGGGNDEDMYKQLSKFIRANRDWLEHYINAQLNRPAG